MHARGRSGSGRRRAACDAVSCLRWISRRFERAWRALATAGAFPGSPLERAEAAIAAADARLVAAWLRALPRAERAALGARVRLLAGARARRVRPAAHRAALRSHLLDLARSAGLTCLRGTV